MLSGLTAFWARALVAAPIALVCVGVVAWAIVSRGAGEEAPPPSVTAPAVAVPPQLELRRPAVAAPQTAGTFTAAFERGIAAYNADDVEAAADAFEEAVRLAPDEPEPHINLGLVYMRLQRPEDGLRELAAGAQLEKARAAELQRAGPADGGTSNGTIEEDEPSSLDDRH